MEEPQKIKLIHVHSNAPTGIKLKTADHSNQIILQIIHQKKCMLTTCTCTFL